jgi:hypothetical protein
MSLEEMDTVIASGRGLTDIELRQIKERATLIRETQGVVRGTKRYTDDCMNVSSKERDEVKYNQIVDRYPQASSDF